jgi:hypothetical protein
MCRGGPHGLVRSVREVPARLRRQKDDRLLRFLRDGDEHAFLADLMRVQVSTRVNQSGGGGLVTPRKKATIST